MLSNSIVSFATQGNLCHCFSSCFDYFLLTEKAAIRSLFSTQNDLSILLKNTYMLFRTSMPIGAWETMVTKLTGGLCHLQSRLTACHSLSSLPILLSYLVHVASHSQEHAYFHLSIKTGSLCVPWASQRYLIQSNELNIFVLRLVL